MISYATTWRATATSRLLVVCALMITACQPSGETSTPSTDPPPSTTEESPSTETPARPSTAQEIVVPDRETLAGLDAPPGIDDTQICRVDTDCRVYQPSDWDPRVECCYEYPCALDYAAVNQQTWTMMRAWQQANPFDCASYVQTSGPCSNRPIRCGLSQEPPDAACVEGTCQVIYPHPWPQIDPNAQACSVNADCRAFWTQSLGYLARCCDYDCREQWIGISAATLDELRTWEETLAPTCDEILAVHTCPAPVQCISRPRVAECRAGLCRVAGN